MASSDERRVALQRRSQLDQFHAALFEGHLGQVLDDIHLDGLDAAEAKWGRRLVCLVAQSAATLLVSEHAEAKLERLRSEK